MQRKKDASVTVYFCLCIVILAGLLLSLLEAARAEGLQTDAGEWSAFAIESLCGGYQKDLFQRFAVFALDGSFGTESLALEYAEAELGELLKENLTNEKGINFYQMQVQAVESDSYALLTDQNGKIFYAYIAEMMKSQLSKQAAQKLADKLQTFSADKTEDLDLESDIRFAEQVLEKLAEEAKAAEEETEVQAAAETEVQIEAIETTMETWANLPRKGNEAAAEESAEEAEKDPAVVNPIEEISSLLNEGLWSLLLPEETKLSNKSMDSSDCLLKRKCQSGTQNETVHIGWYERILFQEYAKNYAGTFKNPASENALSYGMEYLLWGKESDEENLKAAIQSLLLLREGINFAYLEQDTVKQAEALAVAAALAAGNPSAAALLKQGVLAAWACAESICDIRTLLEGKKIPWIKTAETWKTSVSNLADGALEASAAVDKGFGYEDFLAVYLYAKSKKTAAYRMLDIIEKSLSIRADTCIADLTVSITYSANTVFAGIFSKDIPDGYSFETTVRYAYE